MSPDCTSEISFLPQAQPQWLLSLPSPASPLLGTLAPSFRPGPPACVLLGQECPLLLSRRPSLSRPPRPRN
ncbi:unnamed protein product [Chondrus crispus]|uniref:Uncharacterized protein n=1 Tax=Chondrus crispus TaxID=2769 RepID=R7QT63_CHOCR|nr:unnamed protein product [Chondrus crispus]CDF40540.1 unnamed protein product [Chondrus crispus]|eukprot:XP_005710834.1 unnamed protein product [Chondrus crispus]